MCQTHTVDARVEEKQNFLAHVNYTQVEKEK